jgi:phosphate transport system ATP-binding protein
MNPGGTITMAKRIEAVGVTAYYGAFKAIEDISLTVEPKTVTALIGPSGCGKSTFLRSINRMHEVLPGARVDGKLTIDDQDIYDRDVDVTAVRRTIGMVFQRPNPFPTMSIFDNVIAGLRLNGVRKKAILQDAAEKALRSANLWDEVKDRLGKPGAGLSGGQQQRLCIARTIAVEPQVVLMDEPCSALDPISTLAIEDLMFNLKDRYTIIIVTHNMQQAARVSDRTAFFSIERTGDPGRLIEYDYTQKIFSNPSVKKTEDYITGRFG